jgi:hypothetical protein
VENLIGRPLKENEMFSIRPLLIQKPGAEASLAWEAASQLEQYFSEVDKQHPPVSEDQATMALDEALRHVRSRHSSAP